MQFGFGVLGGSIVVAVGGYEDAASGFLVLLGFAVVAVVASVVALAVRKASST